MTGTISKVISEKGFGFIQGEDGQEYFIHRSAVRDGSVFEQLREGQPVVFDAGRGDKGLRAENVRVSRAERIGAQETRRSPYMSEPINASAVIRESGTSRECL